MKKIAILSIILLVGISQVYAQCTPESFEGNSLSKPDSLIPAIETKMYNQVIHLRVPKDTNYMGAIIPIDSAGIIDISGVPSSFTWVTNSPNNYWPGDTFGCILVQGTPTVGEAGNYTLSVKVLVHGYGTSMPFNLDYDFDILDSGHVAINIVRKKNFEVLQNHPNPFSNSTFINFYLPQSDFVYLKLYDIVGNCVMNKKISARQGNNSFKFERADLNSGIYIYELKYGSEIVRKRMIIK